MDIQTFIQNFREAFGKNAELPLVFWYSDEQKGETEKINGCFFKGMRTVRVWVWRWKVENLAGMTR